VRLWSPMPPAELSALCWDSARNRSLCGPVASSTRALTLSVDIPLGVQSEALVDRLSEHPAVVWVQVLFGSPLRLPLWLTPWLLYSELMRH
jgi:hypothetical protein